MSGFAKKSGINRCYPFLGKFKCTSKYGKRNAVKTTYGYSSTEHKGIDIASTDGDHRIVACESGTITKVDYNKYRGNFIWQETDSGFGLIYQHLSEVYVSVGQKVKPKQIIAREGSTGNVSGRHLHFGVSSNVNFDTKDSHWVNPAPWLGVNDYNNIVGMEFDGKGMVSGLPVDVNVVNNNSSATPVESASGSSVSVTGQNSAYDRIEPSGEYYEIKPEDMQGVYSDWLYGRRYRIIVVTGNNEAVELSELRCTFHIEKTAYRKVQKSTLTIYNLSPDVENQIIRSGTRMIIEAGYNGSFYGKIFEGNIIQPIRSRDGTDFMLTLVSMDSDRYITYGIIGCSLVAQQSMREAVSALTSKGTVKTGEGNIADTRIKYPRGKVMFGKATTYLDQIAISQNASYYSENGEVNIIGAPDIDNGYIFDLTPETGLIDSPTQYEYGITCETLLNPMLKLNSLFHVENTRVTGMEVEYGKPVRSLDKSGIYRIIEMKYDGDTRGNNWKITINAIAQAGMLPAMAAGNDVYIF